MSTVQLAAYGTNHALDDVHFYERLKQVIKDRGITCIVETGIAGGYSTVKFCGLVPRVIGIDNDRAAINATSKALLAAGISSEVCSLYLGNSAEVLATPYFEVPDPSRTLYFLDAHNGGGGVGYWPLPDEIKTLPQGKGVLVFHDIKVPGKDFGFDHYFHEGRAQEFEYGLVRNVLTDWSPKHWVEYMDKASGSYRGVAIVYPS